MTIYTIAQPDIIGQLVIMIFEKDIFFLKFSQYNLFKAVGSGGGA